MCAGQCGAHLVYQTVDERARVIVANCKQWGCPRCTPYLIRNLRSEARAGRPETFVTLTSNPAMGANPADRAQRMTRGWKLLVKRIKRSFPSLDFAYLAVTEQTKNGEPHMHILLRAPFIPQDWLSKQWQELTGAFIVDIRRVKDQHSVARYVAKYLAKQPTRWNRQKRFFRSNNWRVVPRKVQDPIWKTAKTRILKHASIAMLLTLAKQQGHRIIASDERGFELALISSGTDPPLWQIAEEHIGLRRKRADWTKDAA